MEITKGQGNPPVLDEDEALELLAYLVTAARTQVDEAAEYGPLRLLTAARRLGAAIAPRASAATAGFVGGPLAAVPELAVPRDGREEYAARLDELCRALAGHLSAHFAQESP
ncbi:DUF6092 family protein [Pseudonocardia halophobica]|uniref:DUF6092 family protein n=1 Tax=Pseudonocardia halophobica TaxID=29401 RepID=UPI003D8F0F38